MKGIAEGTYNTKHTEAARLYYTTTNIHTHTPTCSAIHLRCSGCVREVCLLKGIAEGTYKTKHAEAAKLYYTTIYPHTQTQTQT